MIIMIKGLPDITNAERKDRDDYTQTTSNGWNCLKY